MPTGTGGSEDEIREAINQSLQTRFLPEFLNRIDEIMIFHPLKPEQIRKIVRLQIERLRGQLQEMGIELSTLIDEVISVLPAHGWGLSAKAEAASVAYELLSKGSSTLVRSMRNAIEAAGDAAEITIEHLRAGIAKVEEEPEGG